MGSCFGKDTEEESITARASVGRKLSKSDTRKELDTELRRHEKLYQEIARKWHEVRQGHLGSPNAMLQHLCLVKDSLDVYRKQTYDVNLGWEYRKAAGERLVQSGSVAILCDIAVQNWDEPEIPVYFDITLCVLLTFANRNPTVCNAIDSHGRLLPTVVNKLDRLYQPGKGEKLQMASKDARFAQRCLSLLSNIARAEGSAQLVRQIPRVSQIISKYFAVTDVKMSAVRVVAAIATDDEAEKMNATSDVIQCVLKWLRKAQDSGGHAVVVGAVRHLSKTLACDVKFLARNDANSRTLVLEGALPLIKNGITSDDKEEKKECMEAVWWLSFNKDNREDIKRDNTLVELMVEMYRDPSDPCQSIAEGVLFQLRHQLKLSANQALRSVVSEPKRKEPTNASTGHVMLSYQTASRPVVKMISDFLQKHGIAVWMDIYNMAEGQSSTAQTMTEPVEDAVVFLMGVSEAYKHSQYCRSEAEYAYEKGKPIIPLKLQKGYKPDGWLGFIQGSRFFFDFTN